MPTETTTTSGTTYTQNIPSKVQQEYWGGLGSAAMQLIWPNGQFAQAPIYPGQRTAFTTPLQNQYWDQSAGLGVPDYSKTSALTEQMRDKLMQGVRDPSQIQIQAHYTPQDFNVPQFSYDDPFANYGGGGLGMQVQGPTMGATAADYQTPYDRISMPDKVKEERVNAERIAAERIGGLQQIQAPNLQTFQMGPYERVSGPGGLSSFDINAAAPVTAGTVGTQSFTAPGVASQYMSPYMQNVLDVQKQQAQRDYNQQLTGLRSNAAKAGAFGGTRQAVEEATMNRDLQDRMANIQATGQQQAYQQAQQQFMAEQGMGLQAGQFNVQTGLQAGLANQQMQQQAALANQQAQLAAQGLGTTTGMQAALANQGMGFNVSQANLQSQQQTQALAAQLGMTAQQYNAQQLYNQQLANAQMGLQASMANQSTGLTAQQLNQAANMQAQMFNVQQQMEAEKLNQAAGLQTGMLATQLGFQGAQQVGNWNMQGQLANQQADQAMRARQLAAMQAENQSRTQGALQTQGLGMTAQQLAMQSRQFGAGLDLQAQNAQAQAQQAAQNANLGYYSLGNQMNQQIGNWLSQDYQNQLSRNTVLANAAASQGNYEQSKADRDYAMWQYQQNYPFQLLDWGANLISKMPPQGAVQQQTSGVQTTQTPNPSWWNTAAGAAGMFLGAYANANQSPGSSNFANSGAVDNFGNPLVGSTGDMQNGGGAPPITPPGQMQKNYAVGGLVDDNGDSFDAPSAGLVDDNGEPHDAPPAGLGEDYPSLESRRLSTATDTWHDNPVYKTLKWLVKDPSVALPSPAMIALTPETLPLFTKALEEAKNVTGNPLIDQGLAFLQTRYPRFASRADVMARKLPRNVRGNFYGGGENPFGQITINPERNPALQDTIETLAHEMTHARQFTKGGAEYLTREEAAGIPYLERQIEKLARQGGNRGASNYYKYLELKGPKSEPPNWTSLSNWTP